MAKKRLSKDDRQRCNCLTLLPRLFGKSSYGQVTTAELAKAAGVTEPVIYQHFKTKLDLYVAVLRRSREVTIEHYDKLAENLPTPLLKAIAVVRAHGRDHARERAVLPPALAGAGQLRPAAREAGTEGKLPYLQPATSQAWSNAPRSKGKSTRPWTPSRQPGSS
jgi:AcrR family transcriptional regulator